MITMSKPISASQAREYHKEEFANARDNYYTEGDHVRGEWRGCRMVLSYEKNVFFSCVQKHMKSRTSWPPP